jgi:hypothetical protein
MALNTLPAASNASDHIRPNPSNFFNLLSCPGGKEKLNTNPKKPLKFNFI